MKKTPICCGILLWLFLTGINIINAQDKQLDFIGEQDGLSQGMVYHLLQDKVGYLWIATKDGLNRYDGQQFQVFAHAPENPYSISDHTQHFLLDDSRGWLWIATEQTGVDIFIPKTGRFYHLISNHPNAALHSNNVNMLAEAPDGSVWIATSGGLDRVAVPDYFTFNSLTASVLNDTFKIQNLALGGIYLKGITFIDDAVYWSDEQHVYKAYWHPDSLFEPLKMESLNQGLENHSTTVNQVLQDKFGNLWFIRPHVLTRFDGEHVVQYPLEVSGQKPPAGVLMTESGDEFLIGISSLHLFRIIENGLITEIRLADLGFFYCNNTLKDDAGNIWLGTSGYGLIKYNPNKEFFNHLLPGNSTQHFSEDKRGRIFVWSNYENYQIDEANGEMLKPNDISEKLLNSRVLHQDDSGIYWFHRPFEEEGVKMVKWNPESNEVLELPYDHRPYNLSGIFEDLSHHIWVGTKDAYLLRFDNEAQDYLALNLAGLPEFYNSDFTV